MTCHPNTTVIWPKSHAGEHVVNTSAFLAVLDADDAQHTRASRVWGDLMGGEEELLTTSYMPPAGIRADPPSPGSCRQAANFTVRVRRFRPC